MDFFQPLVVAMANAIYFLSSFFKMYFHPILITGVFWYLWNLYSEQDREQQKNIETMTLD